MTKKSTVANRDGAAQSKMRMWRRTRDASGGRFVVLERGTEYLPRLSEQSGDEYKAYAERAVWLDATGRTREALRGLVFSRDPVSILPAALDYLLTDPAGDGSHLNEFAGHVVSEQLDTGFGAIVVMHSGDPTAPGTAAAPSGRPTLHYYAAEQVIAWRHAAIGGRRTLSHLRLYETVEVPGADEFETTSIPQIRVYDLTAGGCVERLFQERERADKTVDWVVVAPPSTLMRGGQPLMMLPAVLVAADGREAPSNAPLSPLAELNFSHWRTSADYEHALHFCGLPTPYVTGVNTARNRGDIAALGDQPLELGRENIRPARNIETGPSLVLGSSHFLVLENPNAKIGFLTLDPSGVGALREAMTNKEAQMAVLGARMLAPAPNAAESGEALSIRRSAETSGLIELANSVSGALTRALSIAVEWQSGDAVDVVYSLNTDYDTRRMDPQLLTALLAAVNAGRMSLDAFVWNVRRGGLLDPDVSTEDEIERIGAAGPALGSFGLDQFGNAPPIEGGNGQ
jgi:hypothetical protein